MCFSRVHFSPLSEVIDTDLLEATKKQFLDNHRIYFTQFISLTVRESIQRDQKTKLKLIHTWNTFCPQPRSGCALMTQLNFETWSLIKWSYLIMSVDSNVAGRRHFWETYWITRREISTLVLIETQMSIQESVNLFEILNTKSSEKESWFVWEQKLIKKLLSSFVSFKCGVMLIHASRLLMQTCRIFLSQIYFCI